MKIYILQNPQALDKLIHFHEDEKIISVYERRRAFPVPKIPLYTFSKLYELRYARDRWNDYIEFGYRRIR